jgi:hypothetical protein
MDWIKIKRNLVPVIILLCMLQVKMAAMVCVPTTRTRRMETETPPRPSTVLVLLTRPTRAHVHSACPERNLHHLVAAATTTDTVPIVNHTTAASPLLQWRRKRSMKVCLHCFCIRNAFGRVSESGYRGTYVKLINLYRILNWKPEAKGPLGRPDACRSDITFSLPSRENRLILLSKQGRATVPLRATNWVTSDKK